MANDGPIEVSQRARDAAVDIYNVICHDFFTQHILDGMEDECYIVQAFAHFEQATRDDALEMAAGVADNLGGNRADASRPDHDRGDAVIRAMQVRAKTIATAIRALKGGGV